MHRTAFYSSIFRTETPDADDTDEQDTSETDDLAGDFVQGGRPMPHFSQIARLMTRRVPYGISLLFLDRTISRVTFNRFAEVCRHNITFGEIDAERLRALAGMARIMLVPSYEGGSSWEPEPPPQARLLECLDVRQAQSICRLITKQYNVDNHARLIAEIPAILAEYEAGRSPLEISHTRRLSPYGIFREIARELFGVEKLGAISLGRIHASDVLNERAIREYNEISEYDFESPATQLRTLHEAQAREDRFIDFLRRDLNISLLTQEELYAAATIRGEKPITPDALFQSPVEINGIRAHWVDFKSYCGAPISFISRAVQAQYNKYRAAYGEGFIVYEDGMVEGLPYPAISARSLRDVIERDIRLA